MSLLDNELNPEEEMEKAELYRDARREDGLPVWCQSCGDNLAGDSYTCEECNEIARSLPKTKIPKRR